MSYSSDVADIIRAIIILIIGAMIILALLKAI